MSNTTQTTGFVAVFAMPSRQRPVTVAQGAALNGHGDVNAMFGDFTTIGSGIARGCQRGLGGFLGMTGFQGSRPSVIRVAKGDARTGSGVSAELEPAPEWGEPLAKHAETARRRYGAVGECPRRIPA